MFFFEKKNQKTFAPLDRGHFNARDLEQYGSVESLAIQLSHEIARQNKARA